MELKEIYQPINFELDLVKVNIKNQLKIEDENVKEVLSYFFKQEGKFLRPALVILSAKAVSKNISSVFEKQLINLATAVELIHSASLIHDDVIDEGIDRRGQLVLNKKYGNKIAVLAGDFLYTKAFSLLLDLHNPILKSLCTGTTRMCLGEMQELNINGDFSSYYQMIENKTASFISICCQTGGMLGKGKQEEIKGLSDYGLYLGLAYQFYDDLIDGENISFNDIYSRINKLAQKSKESIKSLSSTIFKEKLLKLVDCLLLSKLVEKV